MKAYTLQILTNGELCHPACPFLIDMPDGNPICANFGALGALDRLDGEAVREAGCRQYTRAVDAHQKTPPEGEVDRGGMK